MYIGNNTDLNELYVLHFFRTQLGNIHNRSKFMKEIKKYINKKFPGDKNKKLRKVLNNSYWEMFEAQRSRCINDFERTIENDIRKYENKDIVLMNYMAKMDSYTESYGVQMIFDAKNKIDCINKNIKK